MVPLLFALLLAGCSPIRPAPTDEQVAEQRREKPVDPKTSATAGAGVAGLPFSHGKSFRTLDEYLAHLERHAAPIDQPWWREIRPGVYEHVKRLPGAPREEATREQLMKRFGFTA